MKIVNVKSGKPYQLNPETQIEVERTNPFFNEWGEQTVPIDLPDSDYNRELLHFPDLTQHVRKPDQNIETYIQDGEYFMPCRQAVLGSQRKGSISTSFYMNEGSFYSKIDKTSVQDVFAGEMVEGVSTVKQAIDYCLNLYKTGGNDKLCVFPVALQDDSGSSDEGSYKFLNRMEVTGKYASFYNSVERIELVSGSKILLSPGYYISPFVKANYVLKRIFSYFGYTLLDNFFTETEAFQNMVFLNRVMDTLVNGVIKLEQLLPSCTCADILNLFRKKFFCEFVPDEVAHTVSIVLFHDVISNPSEIDLSGSVVGNPSLEYPENYSQLIISSKDSVSPYATFDSIGELISKYPAVFYDNLTGSFLRSGYKFGGLGVWTFQGINYDQPNWYRVDEIVSACDNRYYCGGILKTTEIEVPETIPVMLKQVYPNVYGLPYIGEYKALNSNLLVGNQTTSEEEEEESNTDGVEKSEEESPILCLCYFDGLDSYGTVSGFIYDTKLKSEKRVYDYSLSCYGENGIFEKFYREYDNILRNSCHTVKAELLLSQHQKMTIPAHAKVILKGEELLSNNLKYNLGGKNEPVESEFYTTRLYDPISLAPSFHDMLPSSSGYHWAPLYTVTDVSESDYNQSFYKDAKVIDIYPPNPTEKDVGKEQYVQYTCVRLEIHSGHIIWGQVVTTTTICYRLVKLWLEAFPDQA